MLRPRPHLERVARAALLTLAPALPALAALALVALALVGGCGSTPRQAPTPADYPGVLRPAESLGADVVLRQRVTAIWEDEQEQRRGFDAVLQKIGPTLTVVGLSPTGAVGFSIVLDCGRIEVTNRMPEELPIPPRFVLLDVQRTFYPWLDEAFREEGGVRRGTVDGEDIVEEWQEGRLLRRRFTRASGEPAGVLEVRYVWDRPEWHVPSRAVLDNGWFGYRLEIETLSVQRLDAAAAAR